MGDHDCQPLIEDYADKSQKQAGLLEYRDAYQGNSGCIYRPLYAAQLSETRLEPAGTTTGEVGSMSEYITIGVFPYVGGITLFEMKIKSACL